MKKSIIFKTMIIMFVPFIFSILRVYWVSESDTLYAMSNFWTYIQLAAETLAYLVMAPAVHFISKDRKKRVNNFWGITSLTVFLSLSLMILVSSLSPFLVEQMKAMDANSSATYEELYGFILITTIGISIKPFINIVVAYLIVENKFKDIFMFTVFNVSLMISYDLIFVSPISNIPISLLTIGFSNILAPFTVYSFLILWLIFKRSVRHPISHIKTWYKDGSAKKLLKMGTPLFFESTIRNVFYVLVTLRIMSGLSSDEWNSWNIVMYILFSIIMIPSSSIDASAMEAYARSDNNKTIFIQQLKWEAVMGVLMFAILFPMTEYFLPWNGNYQDFIPLAQQTMYIVMPFFILMLFSNAIILFFLMDKKAKYILYTTIGVQILQGIPFLILMSLNVMPMNYDWSMWAFNLGILTNLIIGIGFLLKHLNIIKISFNMTVKD